jgi:hypothetical protein
MTKFELISAAAVAVGVIWMFYAGTLWQFVPIGAAIVIVRAVNRGIDADPPAEAPKKGKAK